MVGVPRLLEFAQQFIIANQREFDGSTPAIRPEAVEALNAYVCDAVHRNYARPTFPKMDEKRFALIHQKETTLDATSSSLIGTNYFSRHPYDFPLISDPFPTTFKPTASIAMLAACEAKNLTFADKTQALFAETVEYNDNDVLFYNTLVSILNVINSGSSAVKGRALEEAVESWLVARLVSARMAGMPSIPLYELLGGHSWMSDTSALNVNISTASLQGYVSNSCPLPPISEGADKYAELFNKHVDVSQSTNACMLYQSDAQQSYDSMVVSESDGAVHVLFIDMKSDVTHRTTSIDDEQAYVMDLHKYDQVQKVVDALKHIDPSQLSKVSRALIAGNYTYVYMTTHRSEQIRRGTKRTKMLNEFPSNLVIMTESNTKAFMGILWDVYASARSFLHAQ
jgi:hypothetical protein